MTRVLVVDDHPFFRRCLVEMINASADIEVVGECTNGSQVVAAVGELQPDVVIMDVRMPQLSGLDAAAALQSEQPQVRVVLLTSDTAESSRAAADAAGVIGYLLKGADPPLILDAVRHAASTTSSGPHRRSVTSTGTRIR
jgi:DNA-binding NarL/FixJ family response regulator